MGGGRGEERRRGSEEGGVDAAASAGDRGAAGARRRSGGEIDEKRADHSIGQVSTFTKVISRITGIGVWFYHAMAKSAKTFS